MTSRDAGPAGEADKKFQAYNFRLCLTTVADNKVPVTKPDGYDPRDYELLRRYLAQWPGIRFEKIVRVTPMPNGKTDINTSGPFSTDYLGACWDYPEADAARRKEIWLDHQRWTQGLLWFLGHDPRLPQMLRDEVSQWGYAKDEFVQHDHWPPQIYVRVARRMLGQYVMTQHDVQRRGNSRKADGIAMGSFIMDSHNVQRVLTTDGMVLNEGGIEVPTGDYEIAYRSLIPKQADCDNLLNPVTMSASYVAYCTIRMEPVYMAMGHASGVAAATAASQNLAVQEINVPQLRARLVQQGQIVRYGPPPLSELAGTVVDDEDAQFVGEWTHSTFRNLGFGMGYCHDNGESRGKKRAIFTVPITKSGEYEVRIGVPAYSNRSSKVLVSIAQGAEKTIRTIDQRVAPGGILSLGVFSFKAGNSVTVVISNDGADGIVVADLVQLLLQ